MRSASGSRSARRACGSSSQTALENVILCALGGALAIFLAAKALGATNGFMRALLGEFMPFWWTWSLDGELVIVAGLMLALTVVVVSVLPALSVTRADPNALLKDGVRAGRGLETGRISRALVTVQVALISAVMLVGSAAALIAGAHDELRLRYGHRECVHDGHRVARGSLRDRRGAGVVL